MKFFEIIKEIKRGNLIFDEYKIEKSSIKYFFYLFKTIIFV